MKGSKDGKGPPSTDLLICFPSRSHLTLMPKPICSPARPSEPTTRNRHRIHRNHHLRKSSNKTGGGVPAAGHVSPLLWAKSKSNNSDISEPTSPKVTCAGQIKVRPKPSSCKNWQSVMEEIERLHNNKKQKKRGAWVEALGFKKDVLQFLTCLRSIRFDFRCFGTFPTTEMTSDEEDGDDNEEYDDQFDDAAYIAEEKIQTGKNEKENSTTVFSKWFMILQENNQSKENIKEEVKNKRKTIRSLFNEELVNHDDAEEEEEEEEEVPLPCVPPPNALLLMRCRSAPAKNWQEEKEEEDENSESDEEKEDDTNKGKAKKTEEIQNQSLVVMTYETDFSKFSSDIAKETWVVGGIKDLLSRSRSWKR